MLQIYEIAVYFLTSLHLIVTSIHLGVLFWILHRDSQTVEAANRSGKASFSENNWYRDSEHRKRWFEYYSFMVLTVLYHFVYDVIRLVLPIPFEKRITTYSVILFLISHTMRLSDWFLTTPTVLDLYFNVLQTHTPFDVAIVGSGRDKMKYIFYFVLRVMPLALNIIVTCICFLVAEYECQGYFVCIYSWDHWFQCTVFFGLACRFARDHFDSGKWSHWWLLTLLLCAPIGVIALPFLVLDYIIPVTLVLSIYYELLNASFGIQRLALHDVPS
jgi:hypothetical protein